MHMWYYVRQIFKKQIFCLYRLYFMHVHKHCLITVWHPDVTEKKNNKIAGKESVVWNCNGTLCKDTFIYVFYDLTAVLWLDNMYGNLLASFSKPRGNTINRQMFVWVWVFALLNLSDCAALLKAFNRFFYIRVWFSFTS